MINKKKITFISVFGLENNFIFIVFNNFLMFPCTFFFLKYFFNYITKLLIFSFCIQAESFKKYLFYMKLKYFLIDM